MEFKNGEEIWFIKQYVPRLPYRPFFTYKVHKGILKSVIPNVRIISRDKTVLYTETHYVIKGLPDHIYTEVYATKEEAKLEFKKRKLKEYYKC